MLPESGRSKSEPILIPTICTCGRPRAPSKAVVLEQQPGAGRQKTDKFCCGFDGTPLPMVDTIDSRRANWNSDDARRIVAKNADTRDGRSWARRWPRCLLLFCQIPLIRCCVVTELEGESASTFSRRTPHPYNVLFVRSTTRSGAAHRAGQPM